jgi:Ran GTPase-activating protein (RanGAP) involved in mRNA processing and transport
MDAEQQQQLAQQEMRDEK